MMLKYVQIKKFPGNVEQFHVVEFHVLFVLSVSKAECIIGAGWYIQYVLRVENLKMAWDAIQSSAVEIT